jgi:cell division septation protein DedD
MYLTATDGQCDKFHKLCTVFHVDPSSFAAPVCNATEIHAALVHNKAAVAPCSALVAAAIAHKDTQHLKCPCFHAVSQDDVVHFHCKLKASDSDHDTVYDQWHECHSGDTTFPTETFSVTASVSHTMSAAITVDNSMTAKQIEAAKQKAEALLKPTAKPKKITKKVPHKATHSPTLKPAPKDSANAKESAATKQQIGHDQGSAKSAIIINK